MPPFPAGRYQRAGASPERIAALEQSFDALSVEAQQSLVDQLAALSDYEIGEELATAPAAEPVDEAEPDPVDEPDVEPQKLGPGAIVDQKAGSESGKSDSK